MPIKTLFFDESGFTGYNLLDPSQPIFVVASSDLEPAAAEDILRQSFPKYRGDEFKFTNIWRTNNRGGLIEFGRNAKALEKSAFAWMTDKRFAVLTKMVDFLIEPQTTAAGYDFYADGYCWKYANYIHYGLTEFGTPELYESLVTGYQAFSRKPSRETLLQLQVGLRTMAESIEGPHQLFLEQMADGAEMFERFSDLDNFASSDELHVTSMIATVAHWRKFYSEDFAAVHDASAHFFRHRETWEKVTGTGAPAGLHQSGDGTSVEFPLRVISTQAVDSKDNSSVQFCDVLAGLFAKQFNKRIEGDDRKLLQDVVAAGLGELRFNGVRPSAVFPDFPPRRLDGPDAVDKMREVIFRVKPGGKSTT